MSSISNTHTYTGISKIDFISDADTGLTVHIDTERLHMRPVKATDDDYDRYAALFGDREVMGKFAAMETKTRDQMKDRIDRSWAPRWRGNDPYSALAVFEQSTDAFLGHVVLGHGERKGESELAYAFHPSWWCKGIGTEAITAVVREYAPATVKEGYTLEGKPLERINATARLDNVGSYKILDKVGMRVISTDEKYGATRRHYCVELRELLTEFSG